MSNLTKRLLAIAVMIGASLWALFPRNVVERREAADGSVSYDTIRRFPLKRGLDLAGGLYMSLEVDDTKQAVANESDALDRALVVLRERIDEFGVVEPTVQKVGSNRIIVELPGVDNEERALGIVQQQAFLEFKITDETDAFPRSLPRLDRIIREKGLAPASGTAGDTGRRGSDPLASLFGGDSARGDSLGVATTADSAAQDSLTGATRDGPLSSLIGAGAIPGEYLVSLADARTVERYLSIPEVRAAIPPGRELLWGNDTVSTGQVGYRPLYMVNSRAILLGDKLIDAQPQQSQMEGTVVSFTLSNEGGRRFRTETQRNVGKYMAIVLDKTVMGRPPVIQSAIGTQGQITMGGRRFQDATDLALVLRAGALPVPLRVEEIRKIGPSLGQDAIEQGRNAGVLAVGLVIVIMLVYYRFSGMLAVVGLMFYALVTLAVLAAFNASLTLPGLAGFVLSIGMAVDANFLIFERIREEMALGKSVRTAINEGFDHAWSAIVDTHVTTALTAVILYQFGTGPVQGFAVALLAGLAASMISAIFVVRTLFLLWLQRTNATQPLSI